MPCKITNDTYSIQEQMTANISKAISESHLIRQRQSCFMRTQREYGQTGEQQGADLINIILNQNVLTCILTFLVQPLFVWDKPMTYCCSICLVQKVNTYCERREHGYLADLGICTGERCTFTICKPCQRLLQHRCLSTSCLLL